MSSFSEAIAFLHRLGHQGTGIKIGHLDTGVDGAHPALAGRIAGFQRFGYRGLAEESMSVFDSGCHGTHTAGLLVGGMIDGYCIGVAPAAKLYSGMVIEEGHIVARILAGLDWLMECGVQVVSLSIGIPTKTPIFRTLIQEMTKRNMVVVCCIGNRGAGQASTPGYYPEPIVVGAVDADGAVSPFSGSYHLYDTTECHKPDLIAPGVDILSARPDGGVEKQTGTSMASAQVAGLAALLLSAYPDSSAAAVKAALIQSCDPCCPEPSHRSAAGMVNPLKALKWLEQWNQEPSKVEAPCGWEMQAPLPSRYVDPRLEMQLHMAADTDLCEAVVQFEDEEGVNQIRQFVATHHRAADRKGDIKSLKHGPIVICQAPQIVIKQVLSWSSVCFASACDIDRSV